MAAPGEKFAALAARLESSDSSVLRKAVTEVRKELCGKSGPEGADAVLAACVRPLVKLAERSDSNDILGDVVLTLADIVFTEQVEAAVQAGAVPVFVRLTASPDEDVRRLAVRSLGTVAMTDQACNALVLRCGGLAALLRVIDAAPRPGGYHLYKAVQAANRCFDNRVHTPDLQAAQMAVPTFTRLIAHPDVRVRAEAIQALADMALYSRDHIDCILAQGPLAALVDVISAPLRSTHAQFWFSNQAANSALITINNIAIEADLTQQVVDTGALPAVNTLMNNPHVSGELRNGCCVFIENIARSSTAHVQALVDSQCVESLISCLSDQDAGVRRVAADAVGELAYRGTAEQVGPLLTRRVLAPLREQLHISAGSDNVVTALETLKLLFQAEDKVAAGGSTSSPRQTFAALGGWTALELLRLFHGGDVPYLTSEVLDLLQDLSPSGGCPVRAFARVRPLRAGGREGESGGQCFAVRGDGCVRLLVPAEDGARAEREVTLDRVIRSPESAQAQGAGTDQRAAYNAVCAGVVGELAIGWNVSIIAFGQRGSGKSYTMLGPRSKAEGERGIVPRLCYDLYARLRELQRVRPDMQYSVQLTCAEIYRGEIVDLLAAAAGPPSGAQAALSMQSHPDEGPWIKGLSLRDCPEAADLVRVLEAGDAARHTAANTHHRGHACFTVVVHTMVPLAEEVRRRYAGSFFNTRRAELRLFDLAATDEGSDPDAADPLSVLRNVIDARIQGEQPDDHGCPLTLMLSDSLGGNCKTTLLATVSPHVADAEATRATLDLASRARRIVNKPSSCSAVRRIDRLMCKLERLELTQGDNQQLRARINLLEARLRSLGADVTSSGSGSGDSDAGGDSSEGDDGPGLDEVQVAVGRASGDASDEVV
eukprot:TRINITY_DN28610_c0_g1_i1.p1 TRINITY_DN28610_c0_g1~~TRINITY_DN28610_c0_g1_i1.p1  ORF type:complete len:884 (+),score=250.47 TRINITY_DN28610_c0_g1_i1:87-2738(+)